MIPSEIEIADVVISATLPSVWIDNVAMMGVPLEPWFTIQIWEMLYNGQKSLSSVPIKYSVRVSK